MLSILLTAMLTASCSNKSSPPPPPLASNDYAAFRNPELVAISGYNSDAMEPFISRDGNYLFFNNNAGPPTEKDIFFASRVTDTVFQNSAAIAAVNSATVDGTPTLDKADHFYYVSLAGYNGSTSLVTLYSGTWNGSTVTGSTPLSGLTITTPLIIYFDIESSPDGSTLYLSRGDFRTGGGVPSAADIVIAVDPRGVFAPDPNRAAILANVNTGQLEFAPAISADGLELFFTRFDPGTNSARIYRAVRPATKAIFGAPQLVSAITGFVEGMLFLRMKNRFTTTVRIRAPTGSKSIG